MTLSASQRVALAEIKSSAAEYIVGVDEVGLGCWAGPVTVGAVVAPARWSHERVRDSKKLSAKRREEACRIVSEELPLHVVLQCSMEQLEEVGVHRMRERLTEGCVLFCLRRFPDALVVQDGDVPVVLHGCTQNMVWLAAADALVPAVSAASCVAKTHRDRYMRDMSEVHVHYGFETNVGYGTDAHIEGLRRFGPCPLHRKAFKPVRALTSEWELASRSRC